MKRNIYQIPTSDEISIMYKLDYILPHDIVIDTTKHFFYHRHFNSSPKFMFDLTPEHIEDQKGAISEYLDKRSGRWE